MARVEARSVAAEVVEDRAIRDRSNQPLPVVAVSPVLPAVNSKTPVPCIARDTPRPRDAVIVARPVRTACAALARSCDGPVASAPRGRCRHPRLHQQAPPLAQ